MGMKPKKDTYTTSTSGNKTTKTWEYNDGSGSSVTKTNPSKKLDSKYGIKPPVKKKATPVPMPKRTPGGTAKKITPGPKKKSSSMGTPKPKAKKPTLDDFLLKGKKPPMKIKPGLKRPSDSDVILKGYNNKKYKGK